MAVTHCPQCSVEARELVFHDVKFTHKDGHTHGGEGGRDTYLEAPWPLLTIAQIYRSFGQVYSAAHRRIVRTGKGHRATNGIWFVEFPDYVALLAAHGVEQTKREVSISLRAHTVRQPVALSPFMDPANDWTTAETPGGQLAQGVLPGVPSPEEAGWRRPYSEPITLLRATDCCLGCGTRLAKGDTAYGLRNEQLAWKGMHPHYFACVPCASTLPHRPYKSDRVK